MALSKKQRDIIEQVLIILSPITLGGFIPVFASIWICEKWQLDVATEGAIIVLCQYLFYVLIWTWVFEKILKYSPWN